MFCEPETQVIRFGRPWAAAFSRLSGGYGRSPIRAADHAPEHGKDRSFRKAPVSADIGFLAYSFWKRSGPAPQIGHLKSAGTSSPS